MSTAQRLISGTAISWLQIGVTIVSQLALVPVMLTYWSVEAYGVWLAVTAIISLVSLVDLGHHDFLMYEFMRIGRNDPTQLSRYLWSGLLFSLLISTVQTLAVALLLATDTLSVLFDSVKLANPGLLHEGGVTLLVFSIGWGLTNSLSGLMTKVLLPFGYYPRMAWWGLGLSIFFVVTIIASVVLGASLQLTAVITTGANVLFTGLIYLDLFRLLRREGITYTPPSLGLGYHNFVRSLAVSGKSGLENLRQQGIRLFLPALVGTTGLATFSTLRTGSNLALQGLNTIVQPLMPELMRFLHQRDQARCEAAFGTIWIIVVGIMAPATVVLQLVVEPLYALWTRGRIPFHPLLFALLSIGVLVFALIQPGIAVVKGNNLLRPQVVLSALAAGCVLGGLFGLVPGMGLVGIGVALLVAEIVAAVGYQLVARRWLAANGLQWPRQAYAIVLTSVVLAAAACLAIVWLPAFRWLTLAGALLGLGANAWRYWQVLPRLATERALKMAGEWWRIISRQPVAEPA
ncbi:hypothetical protein CDA63_16705 [Hymenobacter amundsenii]|uniref:Polysaccharide biosynthesis protein C-terminal domain-containing protein n=1 Tax=Hymenobacter amundsenii TaxID=2006685 RepID=A0A246FHD5_9BACT|nr:hypothetical protein [Hymenobacter amundsenii]OWP61942.1 hypothetical protein CDA63_16705 [Hymenobacter amundsenii]